MILKMQPLSLAEVKELAGDLEDRKNVEDYLKKFSKLNKEKAMKLREELSGLNNVKLKEEYLAKVVDFLPKTTEDLNKIFHDISLDEKEANDILQIVGNY